MMKKNLKLLVLFTVLLAAASLITLIMSAYQASQESQTVRPTFPFETRVYRLNPADIELFYVARTVFSTINIVLIIVLIVNYLSIYLKTKSDFTVGLLLFVVFFLIKDIAWSPFVVGYFGFGLFGLGPFAFLPDLFELVGLSALLYLSVKY
ncbi:MAG: hypothetical protein NWF00_02385 [Candidatus Bathyarchaeota archaeon]|nr:hypothetical protein [Candidatus Bathyarchaeota archaeon]